MRPDRIFDVLDLALEARRKGFVVNPMFAGDAGLGKSQIVQQWVKKQQERNPEFGFVDLRLAYYEGPDFVGYPYEYVDSNNVKRMGHALPHFWPTEGEGIIFLEEPNRGNNMVMNCLMQLLTDRAVGPSYKLPEGWIIASAMNKEGSKYDVNSLDAALADRFETFSIDYDFNTFVHFIEKADFHQSVQDYIKSGSWVYKTPDAIGQDGKYISPRTWSKLNAAEKSGASDGDRMQEIHRIMCQSILGKHIGNEYWKFCWDDAPVTAQDIINDREAAFNKLRSQCEKGSHYAGDKIQVTLRSITENYSGWYEGITDKNGHAIDKSEDKIDEATMAEVACIVPSDQAVNLVRDCGYSLIKTQPHLKVRNFFKEFQKRHPECIKFMKSFVRVNRTME
jgi:GTPase SAR1 family protein